MVGLLQTTFSDAFPWWRTGDSLNITMPSYQYRIPINKIRRSHRLIFIKKILCLERPPLYWDGAQFATFQDPSNITNHSATLTLQWRHNQRESVSNHRRLDLFAQPFIRVQIKENIKAPRHWPLWGGFTGDWWIPSTKGQQRGKCFYLMTSSWASRMAANVWLVGRCYTW